MKKQISQDQDMNAKVIRPNDGHDQDTFFRPSDCQDQDMKAKVTRPNDSHDQHTFFWPGYESESHSPER